MECEQCGLVPEMSTIDGKCPFCGVGYTPRYDDVEIEIVPSKERALEMRDLYTWLGTEIAKRPLGEGYKDLEDYLYHLSKLESERYDELANRE